MPEPVLAGPWTKTPGDFYLKVDEGLYSADGYIDPDGQFQDDGSYLALSTSLYLEAGVAEDFHATLYLPYVYARHTFKYGGEPASAGKGGDSSLGLQYGLPGPLPMALKVVVKIPMYALPQDGGVPAVGDGQVDATLSYAIGASFHPVPAYGFIEVGYQFRTEMFPGGEPRDAREFQDCIVLGAQFGYHLMTPLLVAANAQAVIPTADDIYTKRTVELGVQAAYGFGESRRLSIEATASQIYWVRNASEGTGLHLGVSYKTD